MSQENSKLGNEWKENDLRCRHLWEAKSENHRRCKRCGLNQLLKNIQQKCDTMQNFRLAIRMCDEQGWIARNCLIWHKPNVMPSSVKDRFTVDYEPIFFFTKNKKYWFETQYEPMVEGSDTKYRARIRMNKVYNSKEPYKTNTPYATNKISKEVRLGSTENPNRAFGDNKSLERMLELGRNKRSVWKIPTHPFREAHFATFPEKLIEPIIKAGCPKNGIVLDCFMGAGTTALVALKLNRNYVGIELNPDYIKIAEERLRPYKNTLFNKSVDK